jgi:hypothetical protein
MTNAHLIHGPAAQVCVRPIRLKGSSIFKCAVDGVVPVEVKRVAAGGK